MAEELGVGFSTIVGWLKDEKNIIENSKIVNSKNVKKIKLSPYYDVENPLLTWFTNIFRNYDLLVLFCVRYYIFILYYKIRLLLANE